MQEMPCSPDYLSMDSDVWVFCLLSWSKCRGSEARFFLSSR